MATTSDDLQTTIDAKKTLLDSVTAQLADLVSNPKPTYTRTGKDGLQTVDWTSYYKFLRDLQLAEIKAIGELTSLQQRMPGGLSFNLSSSGGNGCNGGAC